MPNTMVLAAAALLLWFYPSGCTAAAASVTTTSAEVAGDSAIEITVDPALVDGLLQAQLQARAAVASGRDAVVTLKPGTHHLTTALRFTDEDTGRGKHAVHYRAEPSAAPGTVAVSGGAPLPVGCFKPTTTGAGMPSLATGLRVFKCELPADFPAASFEQLFVNGKRCPRARWPDFDPHDSTVDGAGFAKVKGSIPHQDRARWGSLSDSGITVDTTTFTNRSWNNPANNATSQFRPLATLPLCLSATYLTLTRARVRLSIIFARVATLQCFSFRGATPAGEY
eukprot:COSAG05_NODE_3046_length_2387_cov_1.999563_2_plen_282_part_00